MSDPPRCTGLRRLSLFYGRCGNVATVICITRGRFTMLQSQAADSRLPFSPDAGVGPDDWYACDDPVHQGVSAPDPVPGRSATTLRTSPVVLRLADWAAQLEAWTAMRELDQRDRLKQAAAAILAEAPELFGPRGAQGAQGAQGSTSWGATGPQGQTGAFGGPRGPTGVQGRP